MDNLITHFLYILNAVVKKLFKEQRLYQRAPHLLLSDSELKAIKAVGEFLEISQYKSLYQCFRSHFAHFFSGLDKTYRIIFTHQASNLRHANQIVEQSIISQLKSNPKLATILGSFIAKTLSLTITAFLTKSTIDLFTPWLA